MIEHSTDPHPNQKVNMQKVLDWLIEIQNGQQAQMKLLRYLLKRDGSLSSSENLTRGASVHLCPALDRILDEQQLPEKALLSVPGQNEASKARKQAGDEPCKSSKTIPSIGTQLAKYRKVLTKSKPSSWKLKLNPVKENAKFNNDLPRQKKDFRNNNIDECNKKTESQFGEDSGCASFSILYPANPQPRDNEDSETVTDIVPKIRGLHMDEIRREFSRSSSWSSYDLLPGYEKSANEKISEMMRDGEQDSLVRLNLGHRKSYPTDDIKNDSIMPTDL